LSKKFLFIVIILQALILVSAVLIGHSIGKPSLKSDFSLDDFKPLINTMQHINDYYRDKDSVSEEKLINGAVKGMVESLGDPYSQFLPPELYKDMMDDTSGKFGGLGIEIGMSGDKGKEQLTVISVFEGNPAYKVGMKAGDQIVEIEGRSTADISLYDAKRELRGEPGSKIKLKVVREHVDEPLDLAITRDVIQVSTVKYKVLDGNIGYIRLSQFSDTTPNDFDKTLKELKEAGVKGLIMDLRSNPGGTLSAAVSVASSFLNENQIVVSTKSRIPEDNMEYRVKKGIYHTDLPLIVLIDRWSASGSEIVVGAIKDYKRGVIMSVNDSTYGKGSVQTIFPMLDGKSGLKLTVAHYYTPSGKDINKVGIAPDIKRPNLTPEQMKMFQQLDSGKDIDEFIKEYGDDILKKIDQSSDNNVKTKFNKLVEKVNNGNIKLDESYIKYAIAEKTKNEIDDYEYDPLIKFAVSRLEGGSVNP
jgi:carboxyl-terminal processing protease